MLPNLNQPTRKWRRINPYICSQCGKPRYSFIFNRAKEKICRSCARNQVPENQPDLFGFKVKLNPDIPKDKIVVGHDSASPNGDYEAVVIGEKKDNGTVEIKRVKYKKPKMTPLEAAKDLIRDEVFRGDSLSDLKSSQMGRANGKYWGEVVSGGRIMIKSLNMEELNPPVIFSLKKIYNEIVMEKKNHDKCGCDRNKIVKGLNKQALGRSDLETKEIIDVAFPPLGRKKK